MTFEMEAEPEKGRSDPGFWSGRSFRFYLTMVLSLAILSMSTVRNALGMAMVCMVNSTAVTDNEKMGSSSSNSNSLAIFSGNDTGPQCKPITDTFLADYNGTIVWSSEEQGAVFSAIFWGGVVAGIPMGLLANKYSPKLLIMAGFITLLASCLLSPVAALYGGVVPTFIVRFIQGMVSQVLFTPASTMIISYWVPINERSTAMSLTTQGNQLSMVMGPPLNAWLCKEKGILGGWPAIFYANGLFIFLSAVIWWILVSDEPGTSRWVSEKEKSFLKHSLGGETKALKSSLKSDFSIPWKRVWLSMSLWSCYICSFSNGLMTATLTSYIPIYYKEVLQMDLTSSGFLSAAPFFAQWIAKLAFSVIADFLKRKTNINRNVICKVFNNLGTFGVGVFLIAVGYTKCSQPIWAVFFLTMANAAYSGLVPGYITSLVCISPALNAIVNAVSRFSNQLASVLAPYIVGSVTTQGTPAQWRIVFFIMAGCMFLSGGIFMIFGTAEIADSDSIGQQDKGSQSDAPASDSPAKTENASVPDQQAPADEQSK